MGTTSSGHQYLSHSSGNACGTSMPSSSCSLCTEDAHAQHVCKEEEEVLVEPCSVLEELGFFHCNRSETSGKKAYRSPARTGGLCNVVPLLLRQGLPPSPVRARCCPKAHCGDSPTVLARQHGSPSIVDGPPPFRITESPPKPTFMKFDWNSPSPLPILPPPSPDAHVDVPLPAAAVVRCSAPVRQLVEGREFENRAGSTLVDIDKEDVHALRTSIAGVTILASEGSSQRLQEKLHEDLDDELVAPVTPNAHCSESLITSPQEMLGENETENPAEPSRPKRPWSSCGARSPYRGGVLSLFTPSPPSPPRRRPMASPTLPDGKDVKDLGEDDQIALAIAVSLQEAGCELQVPKEHESPQQKQIVLEAAPCQQDCSGSVPSSLDQSSPPRPKAKSRRNLLRWRPLRSHKQSI